MKHSPLWSGRGDCRVQLRRGFDREHGLNEALARTYGLGRAAVALAGLRRRRAGRQTRPSPSVHPTSHVDHVYPPGTRPVRGDGHRTPADVADDEQRPVAGRWPSGIELEVGKSTAPGARTSANSTRSRTSTSSGRAGSSRSLRSASQRGSSGQAAAHWSSDAPSRAGGPSRTRGFAASSCSRRSTSRTRRETASPASAAPASATPGEVSRSRAPLRLRATPGRLPQAHGRTPRPADESLQDGAFGKVRGPHPGGLEIFMGEEEVATVIGGQTGDDGIGPLSKGQGTVGLGTSIEPDDDRKAPPGPPRHKRSCQLGEGTASRETGLEVMPPSTSSRRAAAQPDLPPGDRAGKSTSPLEMPRRSMPMASCARRRRPSGRCAPASAAA